VDGGPLSGGKSVLFSGDHFVSEFYIKMIPHGATDNDTCKHVPTSLPLLLA